MAKTTWSKALNNNYVKTVILAAIFLGGVFSFWFGLRVAMRNDYPLLAVASGSMIPTLKVGDLIVVQGVLSANDIYAAPRNLDGNIIVFHRPNLLSELIVHRAIAKVENSGTWYFETKGDNNGGADVWSGPDTYDGMVSSKLLVGKVVGVVPWVGNVPLYIRTPQGIMIIALLFVIVLFIEYVPVLSKKPHTES